MSSLTARPLWAGRSMVLVGILLLALNLRSAVAAFSPIIDHIAVDIPLGPVAVGVIGMLPPIAFAVAGLVAPTVARALGLEATIALACAAMVTGPLVRAVAPDYLVLVLGTIIALAGMGFGNILLPPAVKKYFPDRVGALTSAYATILSIGTAVPALVAAPVATAAGWRASFVLSALLAAVALIPWLVVWLQHRSERRANAQAGLIEEASPALVGRMWHSRTAWAITAAFAVSALNAYAMFAWAPEMLKDIAGVDDVQAGALLSLYAIMGLPFSLIIPVLAVRMRNVGVLVYVGVAFFVAGYAGLLLAPTAATALWIILAGAGPLLFPLCLVLINLRSRSTQASVALSGFVQSVGYAVGAVGPLVVGLIHSATDGWTVPILFLLATSLIAVLAGIVLARPSHVEDEIAAR